MLVRIVKLSIKEENIASFEQLFETTSKQIRNFDGCCFLALHKDRQDATVYFTYSHWENPAALESYRKSLFFRSLWGETKKLFHSKAEAWSLDPLETLI